MADQVVPSGAQSVLRWARERPEAVAISEGGIAFSYLELARQIAATAAVLEAEGVRAGLIVGLECRSPHLRVVLALACEVLGAVHLSFVAADTPEWLAQRCQLILAEHAVEPVAAAGRVVRIDQELVERLAALATHADVSRLAACHGPDAGVRIAMTSGTTGASKLVLKTRRTLNAAVEGYDWALRPVAGDFTYLCSYSPTINGVYTDIIRALRFGNRVRFVWTFEEVVALCGTERCYAFLLTRDAEELAASCKAASVNLDMHYVDVTGSGVSTTLEAALKQTVTPFVGNIYSSNETSLIASRDRDGAYTLVPGVEVRIVDEAWRPVGAGETGRICVRSPLVASAYLWDEALSARHFRDGWFLTSDLGALPAADKLRVLGRFDDMLNIGGVKVAPYPIEQALKALPGVGDAVVLRVETAAEAGMMCVTIEPAPEADRAQVVRRVTEVMRTQAPGAFTVRLEAEFPRTDTGKVRRALLQARADAKPLEMARETA